MEDNIKENTLQVVWNDLFCCGNKIIDTQHQALFVLTNKLLNAIASEQSKVKISAIMTQCMENITQHFQDEEKILSAINFPDIQKHKKEHLEILTEAKELEERYQLSTITVDELFQFWVFNVVIEHIEKEDIKYFSFLSLDSK